jgi:hypothetical protein
MKLRKIVKYEKPRRFDLGLLIGYFFGFIFYLLLEDYFIEKSWAFLIGLMELFLIYLGIRYIRRTTIYEEIKKTKVKEGK